MPLHAYLNFDGNTREVVEFYARVFRTQPPYIMAFGEMPPDPDFPLPEETKHLVMHASLEIDGSTVMFSDVMPGMPYTPGNNINLTYVTKDRDDLVRCYNELKEGGEVQMELQETFWSKTYGAVTDRYGIAWQLDLDSGETSA